MGELVGYTYAAIVKSRILLDQLSPGEAFVNRYVAYRPRASLQCVHGFAIGSHGSRCSEDSREPDVSCVLFLFVLVPLSVPRNVREAFSRYLNTL